MDDFLIEYCRTLKQNDFTVKTESVARNKQGKREYLSENLTRKLMKKLELYFQTKVNIPRIKHGKIQTLNTLFSEEALLLSKYLRNEKKDWVIRIINL